MRVRNIYRKIVPITTIICAFGTMAAGPIKTFEQALQEHHIALTREALVAALQNSDPEVRSLAAAKLLVNDHALDTVQSVTSALAAEENINAKINIAWALGQVANDAGFDALQSICDDKALYIGVRTNAARYMLDMNRASCIDTVIDALQSTVPETGLSLAGRLKNLSGTQADQL